MPIQHTVELTPMQSIAWRASTMIGMTAGQEVTKLREQRDEIQKQINLLYGEANKVYADVLVEIAREHGHKAIPGDAETKEQGGRVSFTWEEPEPAPEPVPEIPPAPKPEDTTPSEATDPMLASLGDCQSPPADEPF